jgi:hypothetical protein
MTEEEKKIEMDAYIDGFKDALWNNEFNREQFDRIKDIVEGHHWHETYIDIEDVEDYIDFNSNVWDRKAIASMCGYEYTKEDVEEARILPITTLDEQYKVELLMKLFKAYGSSMELESALGSELVKKLEHVLI